MSSASPPSQIMPASGGARIVTAGKHLRLADGARFFMRGISYGPFQPNSRGEGFPEDDRLAADVRHLMSLGFNTVRIYDLPNATLLREAEALGLRLIVGIPWAEHVDFLSDRAMRRVIHTRIRDAAERLHAHTCVAAILVGNEIEKTLVRWMGPQRVRDFIESLIETARHQAPAALISYATYPSTEYLVPRNADFLAVNVYLEAADTFTACLSRLQNLAGDKPLIVTEFGIDAKACGASKQAEVMRWQHECVLRGGCAGSVWFAYTDEWHRGGRDVTGWSFGITSRERQERPACAVARDLGSRLALPSNPPRISVVVCTRNGSRTLPECLKSLSALSYPDYEVLVIDDGSQDDTATVAQRFANVRYHRQEHAGLSVARNLGAKLATGSIVAYTDDDCLAHADWLLHLSQAFQESTVVAAGGPNIPPPPRNRVERIVAAAPGAPAHVLLSDTEAEHLPGCNLAIRKAVLERTGGFRAEFTAAGDDVDVCWRLREHGVLRFVPGAMVWHHRRYTVKDYLSQQSGYGHAEALLMKVHPGRFGPLGGARWRGSIYGDRLPADRPVEGSIFHGPFGLGAFQTIYATPAFRWWELLTGLLWIAVMLVAFGARQPWAGMGALVFSIWAAWRVSRHNANSAGLHGVTDRLVLWLLCWLQPVVRERARLLGMLRLGARPSWRPVLPEIVPPEMPHKHAIPLGTLKFWSATNVTRDAWLDEMRRILKASHVIFRQDDGWRWFDIELWPNHELSRAFLSVTEYHGEGRCLTRVRLMLRVRRGLGWNLLLWFIVATILMAAGLHHVMVLGAAAALAAGVLVPLGLWMIRREMRRLAHNAAAAAGLTGMD